MTAVATEPSPARLKPTATTRRTPPRGQRIVTRRGPLAILRSVLFWSHVVMGVSGGVIIFIMSVTGALLGFERQLIARFDGVAKVAPPSASSTRLPLDSLLVLNRIEAAGVASVLFKADRTEPVSVRFRERDKAAQLVDPFSGASVAPVPRGKTAEFMS